MLRGQAIHNLDTTGASALARRLQEGPGKYREGEEPAGMDQVQDENSWSGLANMIREGAFEVDPKESLPSRNFREPVGLLQLCLIWLEQAHPGYSQTPKHPQALLVGVQKVACALIDRGVRPLDEANEAHLIRFALEHDAATILGKLLDVASPKARETVAAWLDTAKQDYKGKPTLTGLDHMMRHDHGQTLGMLIDRGFIDPNRQDEAGRTLAHRARGAGFIEALATRGFDPLLVDHAGQQACEYWFTSQNPGWGATAMRKAWFKAFGGIDGLATQATIAKLSLRNSLLVSHDERIETDIREMGGGKVLVEGQSLLEMAVHQALLNDSGSTFDKDISRYVPRVVFTASDLRRPHSSGVSDAFLYAMAPIPMGTAWGYFREEAYFECPEVKHSLRKQHEAVCRVARHLAPLVNKTPQEYCQAIEEGWLLLLFRRHHEIRKSAKLLECLEQPHPLDPEGRSLLELPQADTRWGELFHGMQSTLIDHATQHTTNPQAWLHMALTRLSNGPRLRPGAIDMHGVPQDNTWETTVLHGLLEQGTLPTPTTLHRLAVETVNAINVRFPVLLNNIQAHHQAMEMETATAQPIGQRQARRRI